MIAGLPVLTMPPDFATAPSPSMRRSISLTQMARLRSALFRGETAIESSQLEFVLHGDEIQEFEWFVNARRGKWGTFWMPSWHQDLIPVTGLSTGAIDLEIEPVGYQQNYLIGRDLEIGRHIFLYREDGELFTTRILGVGGADPEILAMETPAPSDFVLGEFFAGLMLCVRFLTDDFEFEYSGPDIARARVAVQTVIEDASYSDASAS